VRTEEDSEKRICRRSLLVGALVSPVLPSVLGVVEVDHPMERVERAALALADAMRAVHGGSWNVQVSHATGFVAVSKDFA